MRAYSPATQWVNLAITIKVFIADYFSLGCTYVAANLGQTRIFKMASNMAATTRDPLFISAS